MKSTLLLLLMVALPSCVEIPRTEINVRDSKGAPIAGHPMRVELSEGLNRFEWAETDGDPAARTTKSMTGVTDEEGTMVVQYTFDRRQPAMWRQRLGAAKIPNQSVTVTPLRELPAGSSIKVGFPNP